MKTSLIRTKRDYKAALKQLEQLWGAKQGTSEADEIKKLVKAIEKYEVKHYPIEDPDKT